MKKYVALWQIGDVTRGEIIPLSDQEAERLLRLGAVRLIREEKPAEKAPEKAAEPEKPAEAEKPEEPAEEPEETEEELPELGNTEDLIQEEEAPKPKARSRRRTTK